MTLLLGPPGSGKTSLLLALAGKLDKELEVSGKVTYNGHEMHEFVPERTCAYISQRDLQMGELTVRETLDFSGRCQGVGPRFGTAHSYLVTSIGNMCPFGPSTSINRVVKCSVVEHFRACHRPCSTAHSCLPILYLPVTSSLYFGIHHLILYFHSCHQFIVLTINSPSCAHFPTLEATIMYKPKFI